MPLPSHVIVPRLALGALLLASPSLAQATNVFGTLGNFDVVNDTGQEAHGFEIFLGGISSTDVTDTFGGANRGFPPTVERYGSPTVTDVPGGVKITYSATYDTNTGAWTVTTPTGTYATPGESCWTGGTASYPNVPCDHFGVGTSATPTSTTYTWLTGTGPTSQPVAAYLPAPVWNVSPPPPAAPIPGPVVNVQVRAPDEPVEPGAQFGIAQWVKVFTITYENKVELEDLLGGNGIVPQKPSELEFEWMLLQQEFSKPGSGQLESEDNPGEKGESVVRRYEFYKYIGGYNSEGEVKTSRPIVGETIGDFIGAQNGAVNLLLQAATVPEPAGLAMLGAGLLGLAALRRR